jgi:hypothetical protein
MYNFSSSNSLKIVPRTWLGFNAIQLSVGNLYFVCTFRLMVVAPSICGIPIGGGGGAPLHVGFGGALGGPPCNGGGIGGWNSEETKKNKKNLLFYLRPSWAKSYMEMEVAEVVVLISIYFEKMVGKHFH